MEPVSLEGLHPRNMGRMRFQAIAPEVMEILRGELLGDGCLFTQSRYSARYTHGNKHRDYVVWLLGQLTDIEGTIRQSKSTGAWHLQTKSYVNLRSEYDRWYSNGYKCVPDDLILTPTMALHWYLGDGHACIDYERGKVYRVQLCTSGFNRLDVEALMEQLATFDPIKYRDKRNSQGSSFGYSILVRIQFLEWIGGCPQPLKFIYGHKWITDFTVPGVSSYWRG